MRLISLSKDADKFLSTLPPKQFRQIVKDIFKLAKNIEQHDVKKLQGASANFYRKDTGEYRIIFKYDDEVLFITVVGKRNDGDAYRHLNRKT